MTDTETSDMYRCPIHDFETDYPGQMQQHIDQEHPGGAAKDAVEDFLADEYELCERCGDPLDATQPGVWKSANGEQWWHAECYDKIERVEELAEKIRALMVPEGTHDGYSDSFHDQLDNAQVTLEDAARNEKLRQDQDLVTDGGTEQQPVELARCDEHGLVCLETEDNPHHSACITCEFDLPFRPEWTPENTNLADNEFRNRLEWETLQDLVPLMREYLADNQDEPDFWVTHLAWSGNLPSGYTEQERFIPAIGYEWGATRKYILANGAASQTVDSFRENGYGGDSE